MPGMLVGPFIGLVGVLLALVGVQKLVLKVGGGAAPPEVVPFRYHWLAAFLSASISDWLKGPYLYSIYESYGYEGADLTQLFVTGYVSSGIFGLLVGAASDRWGRRRSCCSFGVLYVVASLLIQINSFGVLMLGRILSGVATSLLGTSFDTWVVSEHQRHGHSSATIGQTLALATAGNGFVAVLAGLCGQAVATSFGKKEVFLGAIPFAAASFFLSATLPAENWGRQRAVAAGNGDGKPASASKSPPSLVKLLGKAVKKVAQEPQLQLLMFQQALFEGSMHLFVFVWTPTLQGKLSKGSKTDMGDAEPMPLGLVFACFMVAMMIGSRVLTMVLHDSGKGGKVADPAIRCRHVVTTAFTLGGISLASVSSPVFGRTTKVLIFCMFELCVGLYYPSFGTLKAMQIPDDLRGAMSNLFRVPLNLLVVGTLVYAKDLPVKGILHFCAGCLLLAALLSQMSHALEARVRLARGGSDGAKGHADKAGKKE